mgnify:CR=1 FL=1
MFQNFSFDIEELISETKKYSHVYWKSEDFIDWGNRCLKLKKNIVRLESSYYKDFESLYLEISKINSDSNRFNAEVAKCHSILKRVKKKTHQVIKLMGL